MPKSKKERPSSTAGRQKGQNCQRSQLKNLYCLDNKLYRKNPGLYEKICNVVDNMKGNRPANKGIVGVADLKKQ